MSAIACHLYRIKFPSHIVKQLLSELHLSGLIEPIDPLIPMDSSELEQDRVEVSHQKEKVAAAIATLMTFDKNKGRKKPSLSTKTAEGITNQMPELLPLVDEVRRLGLEKANLEKKLAKVKAELDHFRPYQDIKENIFSDSQLYQSKVVAVTAENLKILKRSLGQIPSFDYYKITQNEQVQLWALLYTPELEEAVANVISNRRLAQLHPSEFIKHTNPSDIYTQLELLSTNLVNQLKTIGNKLHDLAGKHLSDLEKLYDILELKQEQLGLASYVGYLPGEEIASHQLDLDLRQAIASDLNNQGSLVSSLTQQDTLHLDGWIDPESVDKLQQRVRRLSGEVSFKKLSSHNDPEVRVVLKNNRIFRPFEVITSLMGTPGPDEPDPSPYVAPFFIAFFGFALGDAGYGLIMLLASLVMLRRVSRDDLQLRNASKLMFYCAIATIFFGVITGGWFGLNLRESGTIGQQLSQFQLLDLQANIIAVLLGSLAIGFIHQLFGLMLKMGMLINLGKIRQALEDPGSWLLLLLSMTAWAISELLPPLNFLIPAAQIFTLLAIGWFAWGQGAGAKYWFIRPLKGLAGLFNLTSYLSNTLSYARLLALALATGVIASVVNLISVLFSPDIPVLGFVVSALILLLGHSFNIGLNLLGTFINVARLHLVEFFPRFFEAKGTQLQPLRPRPYYSKLIGQLNAKDLNLI